MSLAEWTAISSVAGALVGFGVVWGTARASLNGLRKSHAFLEDQFIHHKDDRSIHVDPPRDHAAVAQLREFISEKFALVNRRLDVIDARCERRGEQCIEHFSHLERKVASVTGNANGE